MWLAVSRIFLLTAFAYPPVSQDAAPAPILLPVEVLGSDGTIVARTVTLNPQQSAAAVALLLQVHGLRYTQQASLQWNDGPWVPLDNSTVQVLSTAKDFGGIGGAVPPSSYVFRFHKATRLKTGRPSP